MGRKRTLGLDSYGIAEPHSPQNLDLVVLYVDAVMKHDPAFVFGDLPKQQMSFAGGPLSRCGKVDWQLTLVVGHVHVVMEVKKESNHITAASGWALRFET